MLIKVIRLAIELYENNDLVFLKNIIFFWLIGKINYIVECNRVHDGNTSI